MYFTRQRLKHRAILYGLLLVIFMSFVSLVVYLHHLHALQHAVQYHRVPPTQPKPPHADLNSTLKRPTSKPGGLNTNMETKSKPIHVPLDMHSYEVINPYLFNFTISNGDVCLRNGSNGTNIFLLILVKCSAGANFDRHLIRKTWGGVSQVDGRRILTMFLVGLTGNSTINATVAEENKQHHDLIQANFMDTYRNLTYKTSLGFRWATEFCQGASYVALADSDILVNVHNIVKRLVNKPRQKYAEGVLFKRESPHRNLKSKWFIPKELYPDPTYAPYLRGAFYVLTTDVASNACREFVHVRFIPWEDAYIGLVLKTVGGVHLENAAGYAEDVNLLRKDDAPIVSALVKSQVVLLDHQSNGVNPKYLKIWEEAMSQLKKDIQM